MPSVFQDLSTSLTFTAETSKTFEISMGLEGAELFSSQLYVSALSVGSSLDSQVTVTLYSNSDRKDDHIIYVAQAQMVFNSLASPASQTDVLLSLNSALDMNEFELMQIIDGANSEQSRILSVAGNNLNLVDGLEHAHASSTPVSKVLEFGGFSLRDSSGAQKIYGKVDFGAASVSLTMQVNMSISSATGVVSVFGREGAVVAATNDYTWAQVDKTTSSLADLATTSAAALTSGTLDDARLSTNVTKQGNIFNGTSQLVQMTAATKLPAVDGSLLTNLPAPSGVILANGTVPFTGDANLNTHKLTGVTEVDAPNATALTLKPASTYALNFGLTNTWAFSEPTAAVLQLLTPSVAGNTYTTILFKQQAAISGTSYNKIQIGCQSNYPNNYLEMGWIGLSGAPGINYTSGGWGLYQTGTLVASLSANVFYLNNAALRFANTGYDIGDYAGAPRDTYAYRSAYIGSLGAWESGAKTGTIYLGTDGTAGTGHSNTIAGAAGGITIKTVNYNQPVSITGGSHTWSFGPGLNGTDIESTGAPLDFFQRANTSSTLSRVWLQGTSNNYLQMINYGSTYTNTPPTARPSMAAILSGSANTNGLVINAQATGAAVLIGAASTNNVQIDVNGLTVLSGGAVKLPDYGSVTTPAEGMIAWDFTNHVLKSYNGSAWV